MASREKVAADDASWVHMDSPDNLMVVTSLVRFERRVDWARIVDAFQTRVIDRFPRFSQRIIDQPPALGSLGGLFWENDPDFGLDHHLQRHQATGPDPDRALAAVIEAQAGVVLSGSRPRWRLHLIDDEHGQSALLLRSHHSLADGLGLVQVLLSLADPPADGGLHPQQMPLVGDLMDPEAMTTQGEPSQRSPHNGRWVSLFEGSVSDRLGGSALRTAAVYRKLGRLADQRNPWRGQLRGTKRFMWSSSVPLDSVKHVATATGATVNDIGLATITSAMHTYFVADGPIPYRIGATIPFNLRPLDEPLVPTIGNQLGLVFVNLPVGMNDRRSRLDHIRRRMAHIKSSPEGEIVRAGMAMIGSLPQRSVARAWMDAFTRKSTAIVTNIAGPTTSLSIAASPIDSFMLWVPTSGQVAVGLSIVTYAGSLRIGIQVDTAVVSDVERFVEHLDTELAQVDRYLSTV